MAYHIPNSGDEGEIVIYYSVSTDFRSTDCDLITGYLRKEKYTSRETDCKLFYGHFECQDCNNSWKGLSWQGYSANCRKCRCRTWPYQVYHLDNTSIVANGSSHNPDLCGKCKETRIHCLSKAKLNRYNKPYHTTDDKVFHNYDNCNNIGIEYYDNGFKKQFELFKFGIKLNPKFINLFYKHVWPYLGKDEEDDFIDALKFSMYKWKENNNPAMASACKNVLRNIH